MRLTYTDTFLRKFFFFFFISPTTLVNTLFEVYFISSVPLLTEGSFGQFARCVKCPRCLNSTKKLRSLITDRRASYKGYLFVDYQFKVFIKIA